MEKNAYSVSCQLVSTHAKLNVLTKWLKKKNIMMSEIVEQEITNLQVDDSAESVPCVAL